MTCKPSKVHPHLMSIYRHCSRSNVKNIYIFTELEAKPRDCADIQHSGSRYSGLYMIYPYGFESGLQVYCDLNTNNGGWLVR